jgi:hypothetical protein
MLANAEGMDKAQKEKNPQLVAAGFLFGAAGRN